MENFAEHLATAKKSIKIADHLTYMTYPLVKDIKIIVSITEHIHNAAIQGMEAILQYDRYYKRINPLTDNLESRFQVFKQKCVPRYNFNGDDMVLIEDLMNLIKHHGDSTMEFVRSDKLIMCSPSFKTKTFDISTIKQYLAKTKRFISKVELAIT